MFKSLARLLLATCLLTSLCLQAQADVEPDSLVALPNGQTFRGQHAYAKDFEKSTALQKTPVWCWAACIQMMLNYANVSWTQEDIVIAIKGYLSTTTASDQEIYGFLNRWGFDYDGRRWRSQCAHHPGPPVPQYLVGELSQNRPLIVSYVTGPGSGHVVVAHEVWFTPTWQGPMIAAIRVFDPMSGGEFLVLGPYIATTTSGTWYVKVEEDG